MCVDDVSNCGVMSGQKVIELEARLKFPTAQSKSVYTGHKVTIRPLLGLETGGGLGVSARQ